MVKSTDEAFKDKTVISETKAQSKSVQIFLCWKWLLVQFFLQTLAFLKVIKIKKISKLQCMPKPSYRLQRDLNTGCWNSVTV